MLKVLREAFELDGWELGTFPHSKELGADLCIRGDGVEYILVFKAAAEARQRELQAYLADVAIRARAAAKSVSASPLAIIGATVLSDRQTNALHEYARTFLEGTAYGLIDLTGRLELVGDFLEGVHFPQQEEESPLRPAPRPAASNLFTDMNQWLLKVMLAPRVPENLLKAPRLVKDPRIAAKNAHRLAKLAGVSPPSAHRFVKLFKELGFVHASKRGLQLMDEERLLKEWRAATTSAPVEYRLQWLIPRSDKTEQLQSVLMRLQTSSNQGSRICVALYAAADRLGFGHVHGVSPHVYHQQPSALVPKSIGAIEAGPDEPADIHLRRPTAPESIFRGAVEIDGLQYTDIIQTWIDASGHSVRGAEQADFIWRHALKPILEGRKPK